MRIPINEKLRKCQQFVLRSPSAREGLSRGERVLWDINAPGLHVLLIAYRFLEFSGDEGARALRYHAARSDFFAKTYAVLSETGISEEENPEVWDRLRRLHRREQAAEDIEEKVNSVRELFSFIQGLLETSLYEEYRARGGEEPAEHPEAFRKLLVAADAFIIRDDEAGYLQLLAGYPWFAESWGRDTFISLPGLLLVTRRFTEAKEVFRFFAARRRSDGLLPNRIFPDGRREYNTADAPLWFIEALHRYDFKADDPDKHVFMKEMMPAVNHIIECYTRREGDIRLDRDKLVVVPAQWTWMDAVVDGRPVTPRNGKPVEIQALFYNALRVAAECNRKYGMHDVAGRMNALADHVKESIRRRFFEGGRHYPFDVLDGDEHAGAVRPNALLLMALSHTKELLTVRQQGPLLSTVERELLTPFGLRSLSPADPRYRGTYDTFAPMSVKDLAYHQGTVWPYLISAYLTAGHDRLTDGRRDGVPIVQRGRTDDLLRAVNATGTVPEVFSGDAPHAAGGAVSQAWSVAALLESTWITTRPDMPGA